MYYKLYTEGQVVHERVLRNDAIRRLFSWIMYSRSVGTYPAQDTILKKLEEELLGTKVDKLSTYNYTMGVIRELDSRYPDAKVITSSLVYPFTVAQRSIKCTVDAVLDPQTQGFTCFVFLDFSDKTLEEDAALQLPNFVIPARHLADTFEMPDKQVKVIIANVYNGKLLYPALDRERLDSHIHMISHVVDGITHGRIYKRLSAGCTTCSFWSKCKSI